ncbi:hypothetical protein TELCIR_07425 [Teladorsagia circumcincta]|uniref:Uncharacterized protein n=1 Tax=Teladorsagia circumcincta TaxID=45464 RepID=A0A2G9UKD7_TELCI|nr:hypothetical protein TELCIR_07425 [Teladorsagia circumcincta]
MCRILDSTDEDSRQRIVEHSVTSPAFKSLRHVSCDYVGPPTIVDDGIACSSLMTGFQEKAAGFQHVDFLCGWGAGCVETCALFPSNKIIFRQQLHGFSASCPVQAVAMPTYHAATPHTHCEGQNEKTIIHRQRGVIILCSSSVKSEGIRRLYRGLLPPLIMRTSSRALMFGLYDEFQATRWKGAKAIEIGDGVRLYYNGEDTKRNGVAIAVAEPLKDHVSAVNRTSDRIMGVQIDTK